MCVRARAAISPQLEALFPDLDPSLESEVCANAVLTTVASLRAAEASFTLEWLLAQGGDPTNVQVIAAILRGQLAGPAKYGILKPQHLSPSSDKQAVLALGECRLPKPPGLLNRLCLNVRVLRLVVAAASEQCASCKTSRRLVCSRGCGWRRPPWRTSRVSAGS
jgi:hypothetical protein